MISYLPTPSGWALAFITLFLFHSNPQHLLMLTQKFSKTFDIGDGRQVTIETGRLARQADGSVTVKMGNSMLLATVVATEEPKPGQEFFPLSVDYMENPKRMSTR